MNIMLTDIRSLTVEMTDIPVIEQGVGDSFPRMLQQQLVSESGDVEQIIDLDEFFSNALVSLQGPGITAASAAESSWRDYLSQQQMQATVDADPIMATPAVLGMVQPRDPMSVIEGAVDMLELPGQTLPASGNILPEVVGNLEISSVDADLPGSVMALAKPGASREPAEPESGTIPVQPELVAMSVEASDTGIVAGTIPSNPAVAEASPAPNRPLPARLAGAEAIPEIRAPIGNVETPKAGRIQQSANSTSSLPAGAAYPARPDNAPEPVPRSLVPGKEPLDGVEISAKLSQEGVSREAPTARESMQSVAQALRETPVIKGLASTREIPPAADPTGPADARDALRNLAPAARAPVEAAVPEPGASRAHELPLQQAGNQSSQPVISMPSNSYSVTQGNSASAPSITQMLLPSGLETMNLARGADAAEWGNGLSERVNWMINQKQNSATIRLDPPMLGKLDVQVRIADDATTITIQTQHAQTRDLIETASLRLRDSLQENGFQNVNVDVSQRQDQQQSRSQTAGDEQSALHDELDRDSESAIQHESHTRFFTGEGLLDTFA